MISIDNFQSKDANAVAYLHQSFLKTPLKGKTGLQLLTLYYKALQLSNGGVIFVARNFDGVYGYVCGLWNAKLVRQFLIKTYWPNLIWLGGVLVLTQKSTLFNLFTRFSDDKAISQNKETDLGYELRPIVVGPNFRGTGVSALLLERLCVDARDRGFDSIFLYVEENNLAAQKFYEKRGFVIRGKEIHDRYLAYKMELSLK